MSSTLIHGASEAVLVDTPVTNDQVDALVDWIEGFDVNLTTICIIHGPCRPLDRTRPTPAALPQ